MHNCLSHTLLRCVAAMLAVVVWGCSSTRHVPEGKYLLDKNRVEIVGGDRADAKASELSYYLRQQPNHKVFGLAKLGLGIYNMSGRDSTKWVNRWVRSLGDAPVIYDRTLTDRSLSQLEQAMVNRGYRNATVEAVEHIDSAKRKASVTYRITPGRQHLIENVDYTFDDPAMGVEIMADSALFAVKPGTPLNLDLLDEERDDIAKRLRDRGYYAFSKQYIRFTADTVAGGSGVDLKMHVLNALPDGNVVTETPNRRYIIDRVICRVEAPDTTKMAARRDSVVTPALTVIYDGDHFLHPGFIASKCFLHPGEPFRASDVSRTYEAFSQLGIVKYVNIAFDVVEPSAENDYTGLLTPIITISRSKLQNVTVEIDGTNSEGDLGCAFGVAYRHRDIFHGAEQFSAKVRGSYESLSGNFEGFINNRYTEYSAELGLSFQGLTAPFVPERYRRNINASSELALQFNFQERPEYTRVISGAAWKYRWNNRYNSAGGTSRHSFDLVDISLVNLTKSTIDFINTIAPNNPLLRYSYEDHLIMRMGYSYYRSNRRTPQPGRIAETPFQRSVYTLRISGETAGNLLYAISSLTGAHRHDGAYKVFGTQYAQYVKADFDYSRIYNFSRRTSFAWHVGFGIEVPYGNSSMVPFEKRFYAGGANSVRGWSVRTLGPGCYDSRNSVTDFINQCGDIRFDLNVEFRSKLFWVVEGALFIDAGNIWTIHNYENQPGGMFKFNQFYKQIAAAYGVGIRLDFTYFLLRFDLGMKAHNPARGAEPWPLIHPDWSRDRTFHFSIGYPF